MYLTRSFTDGTPLGILDGAFRAKLMLETLAAQDIFGKDTPRKGGNDCIDAETLFL
jgi:hypothetical protein